MAFHVACPLTCRRICYCELGFRPGLRRGAFLEEIGALEEFLRDSWTFRPAAGEDGAVQVWVPRVVVDDGGSGRGGGAMDDDVQRAGRKRQKLVASLPTEGFVRSSEDGGATDVLGEATNTGAREDHAITTDKVVCHICFSGESEESDKASKMLPCKLCNKKYHRSCMKLVAEHRDLFNWSSWSCPSCRICEVCRRTGDPNKLMYCKRCDDAYHCYCQHPPHKNVGRGPYLCSKHTRCYSCSSIVPGSGPSTRWFLCYTCCDACGRLFVKGNYCPICLKVYRDSEATPMVCCDVCEKWVHCGCDDISDEKYQRYQTDQNLQYNCAACRGDCYQVKNIDDAVRELWKRKDIADYDLIASLRAAAGLPFQQEINSMSPHLEDEPKRPIVLKNNYSKTIKFSLNGIQDESTKERGKIVSNEKQAERSRRQIKLIDKTGLTHPNIKGHNESGSSKYNSRNGITSPNILSASTFGSPDSNAVKLCTNELDPCDQNMAKEAAARNTTDMVPNIKIKSRTLKGLPHGECSRSANKVEIARNAKLVIHSGQINNNVASSSPRSEAPRHADQDLDSSLGDGSSKHRRKDNISLEKFRIVYEKRPKVKESVEPSDNIPETQSVHASLKSLKEDNKISSSNFSSSFFNDPKPPLKPKFKNPFSEQGSSRAVQGVENSTTGPRSKRKRPSSGNWGRWQDEVQT